MYLHPIVTILSETRTHCHFLQTPPYYPLSYRVQIPTYFVQRVKISTTGQSKSLEIKVIYSVDMTPIGISINLDYLVLINLITNCTFSFTHCLILLCEIPIVLFRLKVVQQLLFLQISRRSCYLMFSS